MTRYKCRDVGLRLQSYLDDELDPERMERIRAHLDACVECGLEYDVYTALKSDVAARREPTDPAALDRLREFARGVGGRDEVWRQA